MDMEKDTQMESILYWTPQSNPIQYSSTDATGLPTFCMMMIMFSFSLESFQPRQIGVNGDCDGDYRNCEDEGGGIWKDGDSDGGDG